MTPDAIRARLDAVGDHAAPEAIAALRAVLDLHREFRIYDDDCGHDHPVDDETGYPTEPGVVLANGLGAVCEDGFLYAACRECCLDNDDEQREECADAHGHAAGDPLCGTVRAIAAALGVAEPAQPTERECDHDLCEDGACTKYGQPPVSAQAEPRVWRDGDAEPEDHPDVTDRYGNAWTWRLGLWFRTNQSVGPTWWSLVRRVGPLTEVTDQAGEAR